MRSILLAGKQMVSEVDDITKVCWCGRAHHREFRKRHIHLDGGIKIPLTRHDLPRICQIAKHAQQNVNAPNCLFFRQYNHCSIPNPCAYIVVLSVRKNSVQRAYLNVLFENRLIVEQLSAQITQVGKLAEIIRENAVSQISFRCRMLLLLHHLIKPIAKPSANLILVRPLSKRRQLIRSGSAFFGAT